VELQAETVELQADKLKSKKHSEKFKGTSIPPRRRREHYDKVYMERNLKKCAFWYDYVFLTMDDL
jgi:hypothetical protein